MTERATTDAPVTDTPVTDAAAATVATATPFTMVSGDASAMVCEGDVCYIPSAVGGAGDPA